MKATEQYFLWHLYYEVQGGTYSIKESFNCDHSIERYCTVLFFCHSVYSALNFGVAVRAIGKIRKCTRITPRESRGGDFHARSHFARSTIPEEK